MGVELNSGHWVGTPRNGLCILLLENEIWYPSGLFEGAGLAMLMFYNGYNKNVVTMFIVLGVFIVAVIVDPLLWEWNGLKTEHAGLISIVVNGALTSIAIAFYVLGRVSRRLLPVRVSSP